MPFSATVFNVLIASPSDVPEERDAIARSLHEWNALHSQTTGNVLLPVMWESHSAPAMGDRPQGIINNQVVRNCDMLIGAFWTRLGSPTGVEESGTVEEIKWFLKQNKPVMLYYSKQHVDLDSIDTAQLEKLKEFKKSIKDKGLQDQYASLDELKQKLARHLIIITRDMTLGPVVDSRVVKAAKASTSDNLPSEEASDTSMKKTTTPRPKEEKIWLEDYSEKSFVVKGNSIEFSNELSSMGGKWIPLKTGGKGWNFSKKRLDEVAKTLKISSKFRV